MIYGKFTDNGKEDLGIMLGFWWFSPTDKKKNCLEDAMATEMEEL